MAGSTAHGAAPGAAEILKDAANLLARVSLALEQAKGPMDASSLEEVYRDLHSYKGLVSFAGLHTHAAVAGRLEQLLAGVWRGRVPLDEKTAALLAAGLKLLAQLPPEPSPAFSPEQEAVRRLLFEVGEAGAAGSAVPEGSQDNPGASSDGVPPLSHAAGTAVPDQLETVEDLAVRTKRLLDRLGELIREDRNMALVVLAAARQNAGQLCALLHQLRYVPVKEVLEPLAAMGQSLASKAGKAVRIAVEADDVEVAQPIASVLRRSAVHLLRNAIVHGIEPAGKRQSGGKPREAQVVLRAFRQGDALVLEVSDDGAGFDLAALQEAAARVQGHGGTGESGLIGLAFLPGVSTAAEATELAGNGMGLAAVEHDALVLGGKVEVSFQEGQGSTVRLLLPLQRAQFGC